MTEVSLAYYKKIFGFMSASEFLSTLAADNGEFVQYSDTYPVSAALQGSSSTYPYTMLLSNGVANNARYLSYMKNYLYKPKYGNSSERSAFRMSFTMAQKTADLCTFGFYGTVNGGGYVAYRIAYISGTYKLQLVEDTNHYDIGGSAPTTIHQTRDLDSIVMTDLNTYEMVLQLTVEENTELVGLILKVNGNYSSMLIDFKDADFRFANGIKPFFGMAGQNAEYYFGRLEVRI